MSKCVCTLRCFLAIYHNMPCYLLYVWAYWLFSSRVQTEKINKNNENYEVDL